MNRTFSFLITCALGVLLAGQAFGQEATAAQTLPASEAEPNNAANVANVDGGVEKEPSVSEAKVETHPIHATLLVIELDWSNSPTAKEVLEDLSAAFKDVDISPEMRSKLLRVAPQILFTNHIAAHYSPDHAAGFLKWMLKHQLARASLVGVPWTLPVPQHGGKFKAGGLAQNHTRRGVVLDEQKGIVTVSDYQAALGPFVQRSRNPIWTIHESEIAERQFVHSYLSIADRQHQLGDKEPNTVQKKFLCHLQIELPPGSIVFVNGFAEPYSEPHSVDSGLKAGSGGIVSNGERLNHLRNLSATQGTMPLLIFFRDEGPSDALPAFHLPDSVKVVGGSVDSRQGTGDFKFDLNPSEASQRRVLPGIRSRRTVQGGAIQLDEFDTKENDVLPVKKDASVPHAKLPTATKIDSDTSDQTTKPRGLASHTVRERRLRSGERGAYVRSEVTELEPKSDSVIGLAGLQRGQTTPTAATVAISNSLIDELSKQYKEFETRANLLAAEFRKNPDQMKDQRDRLQEIVVKAFEKRQELQKLELAEFQKRLAAVQQTLEAREREKAQIIQRRVDELLNPNLDWETSQTGKPGESQKGEQDESQKLIGQRVRK